MISCFVEKFGPQKTSYILFAISQLLFPLGFIYANDNKINPVETSLLRGIAAVILNFSLSRYYDVTLDYKYDITFFNLFKRNSIVVLHMLAIGTAQFYLPLPIVHTINFFSPIFVFIIDYFENGITINKKQLYCLLAGIVGIICAINDELINKFMDDHYEMKT
jgi:drug/metabolite transporter (DMT)-like permease